jgi:hypothetical protein
MASVRAQWVRYYAECEMNFQTGQRTVGSADMDRYFIMCGGPYTAHDHSSSWCGIFATYVMRQAGVDVCWKMSKGIQLGSNVELIMGNSGLDQGDVVWATPNHYFIIMWPPGDSGVPWAIHGNYGGAGANHVMFYGFHPKYPVSSIKQYYRAK